MKKVEAKITIAGIIQRKGEREVARTKEKKNEQ